MLHLIRLSPRLIVLLCLTIAPPLAAETKPEFLKASTADLARPYDLTLNPAANLLYVADSENFGIKVLDPYSLQEKGSFGEGDLDTPRDLAFTPDGRLLVADTGNDRVLIYAVEGAGGTLLGEIAKDVFSPEGVATDRKGDLLVVSGTTHNLTRVRERRAVQTIGGRGSESGKFDRPHDVEVRSNGYVYVADSGNNRVQVFNAKMKPVTIVGRGSAGLSYPNYLALDEQERLYVTDRNNNQVKVYDADLKLVTILGTGKPDKSDEGFHHPSGIEARKGYIWISDTKNDRIVLYQWGSN